MVSIIVPVYNEERTVGKVIEELLSLSLGVKKEIIVINDGSTDGTKNIIENYKGIKVIHLEKNMGKAYAVREGIKQSKGEYVVFQDADLEYPVDNIISLYKAITDTDADMVIGIRTLSWDKVLDVTFGSFIANKVIKKLTGGYDIFSGHRIIKRTILNNICIESMGFEIETEIFLKLSSGNYSIKWIPISYIPRKRSEGKKIGFKDFISILYTYYRLKYKLKYNSLQKPLPSHS